MISDMPLDIVVLYWALVLPVFGFSTAVALHVAPEVIEAVRAEIALAPWDDQPKRLPAPHQGEAA